MKDCLAFLLLYLSSAWRVDLLRRRTNRSFSRVAFLFCAFFLLTSTWARAQRPPTSSTIDYLSYLEIDLVRPGARPAALGGAFIAAAQDEMASIYNPAGLIYLNRPSVAAHIRFIGFTERFEVSSGEIDQFTVAVVLPVNSFSFAYSRHILFNDKTDFSIRQFLTIDSDLTRRQVLGGIGNFPGKYVQVHLRAMKDNFSLAYRISSRLSIGITLHGYALDLDLDDRSFLDPSLTNGKQTPRGNIAETTYSIANVDERIAYKWAGGIGLMLNLIPEKLFLGAVHSRGATFDMFGEVFLPEFRLESQPLQGEVQFRTFKFRFPDTYGVGLYYRVHSRLSLTFDVLRIEYSDLLFGNDLNVPADDKFNEQIQNYEDPDGRSDLTIADATEFHFGVEWLVRIQKLGLFLPIRLGAYTDPGHRVHAVSKNPDLQRLYPEANDRVHLSFGTGFVFQHGKFDTAFDFADNSFQWFLSWALILP